MNLVALMGSPRKGGNTDLLTDALIEGAASEGAACEKVFLDDLNIRPIGPVGDDWAMRVDTRGDDDARALLEKVAAAVLSTTSTSHSSKSSTSPPTASPACPPTRTCSPPKKSKPSPNTS